MYEFKPILYLTAHEQVRVRVQVLVLVRVHTCTSTSEYLETQNLKKK